MGTRHITAVVLDGKFVVSQYGQWDGYPIGQGSTVLDFLKDTNLDDFKEKLEHIREFTKNEISHIEEKYPDDWPMVYPQLTRNTGAEILTLIDEADGNISIQLDLEFPYDSLFCEWMYLINLDTDELEVYRGFNKELITEGRFLSKDIPESAMGKKDYHPVKLVMTYDFERLPSTDQFVSDLEIEDDDE